jgi:hypothetical protein
MIACASLSTNAAAAAAAASIPTLSVSCVDLAKNNAACEEKWSSLLLNDVTMHIDGDREEVPLHGVVARARKLSDVLLW